MTDNSTSLDFHPIVDQAMNWIANHGINVVLIILVALIIDRFIGLIITRIVNNAIDPDKYTSKREERLREKTITGLLIAIAHGAIGLTVLILVLNELSVNIGALLAGAGVIGFVIGFGAQSLIKDFIAGIFIVLENQYRVGDIVELNGIGGQVKKITTRITVLRDLDGNVHYIPNGSISMATNMTMEYAKINMKIGVSYDSDIEKVKDVINDVGLKLAKDKDWSKFITEAPYFARVNDFADSAIIIRIFGKTLPAKQWSIEGELRKRIKIAFDKNKIVIPFQQVVIHQAKKSDKN